MGATPAGELIPAAVARPPSPENPGRPIPATVVIAPATAAGAVTAAATSARDAASPSCVPRARSRAPRGFSCRDARLGVMVWSLEVETLTLVAAHVHFCDVRQTSAYCLVALTNFTVPLLSVIWKLILNVWPLASTAVQVNVLPFLTPTSDGHLTDFVDPPLAATTCFVNPSALPWSMTLLPQPMSAGAPTPTATGKTTRV